MAEGDSQDALQQSHSVEPAPQAEPVDASPEAGITAEAQDAQPEEKHPLAPGGDRFNQVYARAKDAEAKLQSERERAARLQGELDALSKISQAKAEDATKDVPKRYTWQQLQQAVDDNKITMADAVAYERETVKLEAKREAQQIVTTALETTRKQSTIQSEHGRYTAALPELRDQNSNEFKKVAQEFTYLVNVLGYDKDDPKTEVIAIRNAHGSPEEIMARKEAAKIKPQERETMQENSASGGGSNKPPKKDPLSTLSPAQKEHYNRMISRGVYKNWGEVKAELEWAPPVAR
jgi:hypothetical protein